MNTHPMPKGATLIDPPKVSAIGSWVEMELDAQVERFGITLYRVKDGMGGRGDREDWIADIPATGISVHDYQWRAPYWGLERYKSFDAAVRAQLTRALNHAKECQRKALAKHAALSKAIRHIGKAIKLAKR